MSRLNKALLIEAGVFFLIVAALGAYALYTELDSDQFSMLMIELVAIDLVVTLVIYFKYREIGEHNEKN